MDMFENDVDSLCTIKVVKYMYQTVRHIAPKTSDASDQNPALLMVNLPLFDSYKPRKTKDKEDIKV